MTLHALALFLGTSISVAGTSPAQQDSATLAQEMAALEAQRLRLEVNKLNLEVQQLEGRVGLTGRLLDYLVVFLSLVVGAAGGFGGYFIAAKGRRNQLDLSVHEKRLKWYPHLVKTGAPLAVYFPPVDDSHQALQPGDCAEMGRAMSEWYFKGGGILLSKESQDAYFSLIRALTRASKADQLQAPRFPDEAEKVSKELLRRYREDLEGQGCELDNVEGWDFGSPGTGEAARFRDYVFVQRLSSALRSALSEDLRSRRRPADLAV